MERMGISASRAIQAEAPATRYDHSRGVSLCVQMSQDVNYATKLAHACAPYNLKWIEECLPPQQ